MIRPLLAGLAVGLGTALAGGALLLRQGVRRTRTVAPQPGLRLQYGVLRELFNSLHDAILLVHAPDRIILGCNPAAERMFGYRRRDLIGCSTRVLYGSDDEYERIAHQGRAALERGRVFHTEYTMRRRDDAAFPVELTISLVRSADDGSPELVVAVVRDITERHRAAEALRAAHQRRNAMFEASPLAIIRLDESGRVADWSRAAARILGWRAGEVIGRHAPFVPEDTATEFGELFRRLRGGETLSGIEGRPRRKDGSRFDALMSAAPLRSREGEFTGALVIIADISRQRDLERQLLEVTEQERNRLGEDLHDSLGQILTGVSFAARALKGDLAERGRPEAALAAEIERLMADAVDRTRQLARGLSPVLLRGGTVQAALADLCEETAEIFDVDCELHADPELELSESEARHLYYIAREAIHNAVRHGRATRIDVRLARTGAGYVLTIHDNGSGLPLAPDAEDDGFGLTIMRHRCTLIGGRLALESGPDGTSVICRVDPARSDWQL